MVRAPWTNEPSSSQSSTSCEQRRPWRVTLQGGPNAPLPNDRTRTGHHGGSASGSQAVPAWTAEPSPSSRQSSRPPFRSPIPTRTPRHPTKRPETSTASQRPPALGSYWLTGPASHPHITAHIERYSAHRLPVMCGSKLKICAVRGAARSTTSSRRTPSNLHQRR